jgi:septum formation protein
VTCPIVLASGSPRRRELLGRLGLPFTVDVPQVDEDAIAQGLAPMQAAARLAEEKAAAIAAAHPKAVVIGCDTLVVRDGLSLGKPKDESHAVDMILSLAGRSHEVLTGVALVPGEGCAVLREPQAAVEVTRVSFRPLTRAQAEAYVARGESLDKAGAYGIQGFGSLLVPSIEGCYFNVVGLPLHRLGIMLEGLGLKLL